IAKKELVYQNKLLEALFKNSTDAIAYFDENNKIIDINQNFQDLFGHRLEEIQGKEVDDVLETGKRESANRDYTRSVLSGRKIVEEGTRYTKNGRPIEVLIKGVPVIIDGKLTGGFAIYADITDRKQTEETLKYQLRYENLIADISTKFVNVSVKNLNDIIDYALRLSGEFFAVDRSYMFLYSADRKTMDNTHEWCAEGIETQKARLHNFPVTFFPWLLEQIEKPRHVNIPDVEKLPIEAEAEKQEFKQQKIKSLLLIPMLMDGKPVGFFGYDSVKQNKIWPEEYIAPLKVMAEIISNAFQKSQSEKALQERESQLNTLLNNTPGMIYRCLNDNNWTMEFISNGCYELTGYHPVELINNNVLSYNDLILPEYRDELWIKWQTILAKKQKFEGEYRITTATGDIKWVWERGNGVFGDQDKLLFLEGYITDITERNQVRDALRQSEERYREILASIEDGYFEVDLQGSITFCNAASARMLGYQVDELMKMNYRSFCKDHQIVFNIFNQLFLTGKKEQAMAMEMIKKDGSERYGELTFSLLHDKDGNLIGFRGIGRDVTERKQYEENLKYLTLHDQLTGLYNRVYFENELERLSSSREHPITIMSIDLDGLKLVNDTVGHERGDRLLIACANVLKKILRSSDILARVGGDEFVALLPRTDGITGEDIAMRIHPQVEFYNHEQPNRLPLSLSLGLSTAETENASLQDTYKEADDLMYRAKLHKGVDARSQIIQSLMAALGERDFITEGHARRLEKFCYKIGKEINLSNKQLSDLVLLAQVHDLGKVGTPDKVLFKQGFLNDKEWELMRQHSEKGYRIALSSTDLSGIADLILKHHERWDGSGYPLGISGEEIPIECRILAIVDAFDAMTHDRPYRKSIKKKEAVIELQKNAGTQFDPNLVPVFLSVI
ncbi:MAG: PAS domain S-box protein, partial [Clostridia bacterium]|nr:PAS domain S-box protein [Clostridia bacterium]